MAEENKKININSFFDRVEEVDMVAGNALRQVNLNANAIQANKTLINSLSVTIEAMRTEIRDIANYIVIENKLERDKEKDRELEAEDARQKQEMTERALAAGQQDRKGTPGEPAPEKAGGAGGGFLSGLLGAIAAGGLIKLALPLVGLMAPLLLKAMAVGIGVIALGLLVKKLAEVVPQIYKTVKDGLAAGFKKIGESITALRENVVKLGKQVGAFASKKFKQTLNLGKRVFGGIADFATGGIFDFDKKGESITDKVSQFPILKKGFDGAVGSLKERGVKGVAAGIADTFTGGIFDFDKKGDTKIQEGQQKLFEKGKETISNTAEKVKNRVGDAFEKGKDAVFNIGDAITDDEGKPKGIFRGLAGALDFATGGRFDLDKRGSSVTDEASPLGQVIKAVSPPKIDSSSFAPAKGPNTSQVVIRSTSPSIPFIKTVKNQYLSTNPGTNKLPPEIARLIQ